MKIIEELHIVQDHVDMYLYAAEDKSGGLFYLAVQKGQPVVIVRGSTEKERSVFEAVFGH